VCIERCKPGSEGGAGVSSQEASRAYPTGTAFRPGLREPARPRRGALGDRFQTGDRVPKFGTGTSPSLCALDYFNDFG
jgi:hypothetical protein